LALPAFWSEHPDETSVGVSSAASEESAVRALLRFLGHLAFSTSQPESLTVDLMSFRIGIAGDCQNHA
jgi:hypothetical protein